jgi:hypothetical protein
MDAEANEETAVASALSRCSTALSVRTPEDLTIPSTERALTAQSTSNGDVIVRGDYESSLVPHYGGLEVTVYAPMDAVPQDNEAEPDMYADSTTMHVREATLQVDPDPQPALSPHRPATVPLPPSPSRWNASRPTSSAFFPPSGNNSPARRRNSLSSAAGRDHREGAGVAESIDLSGETLEVNMSRDGFVLPAESRTIVGPENRAVAQLLAGHVHSALLYIADGQYCSKFGPDDLPGLCAWKLVSITVHPHSS